VLTTQAAASVREARSLITVTFNNYVIEFTYLLIVYDITLLD